MQTQTMKRRLAQWLESDDFRHWLHDDTARRPSGRWLRRVERLRHKWEHRRDHGRNPLALGFLGAFGVLGGVVVFGLVLGTLAMLATLLGLAIRLAMVVGVVWLVMRVVRGRRASSTAVVPVDYDRY